MASNDTFTAEVPKEIEEDPAFKEWREKVDGSHDVKIEAAIEKIKNEGVVTSAKDLQDGLYEKKWNSGLRLYFAVIEKANGKKTLLILGSGKGKEQDRAIKESKKILKGYQVDRSSRVKKD
jgi:putative addiction module killer protein